MINVTNFEEMDFWLQSSRKFQFSLHFYCAKFPENYKQFTEKFFENIIEIQLWNGASLSSFSDIIASFMYLKNLQILVLGCEFKTYEYLPDNLSLSIKDLFLSRGGIPKNLMDISVFYSILSFTPNLEELTVYVNNYDEQREIVKQLKDPEVTKSIKMLMWYDRNKISTTHFFCDFYDIKNLNLEKFTFSSEHFPIEKLEKLESFLSNQKKLNALHLVLSNLKLLEIRIFSLKNLQSLSIEYSKFFTNLDDNWKCLWKLKHLKLCCGIRTIFKYLNKNCGMESLQLTNKDEAEIPFDLNKFQFLINLKSLILIVKFTYFKMDNLLQAILKHLINLQILYLADLNETRVEDVSFFYIFS